MRFLQVDYLDKLNAITIMR